MYAVDHRFEDLEEGMVVLWNGHEEPVEEVGEEYAVIGGEHLSKPRVNGLFKSHDEPFEVVQ